MLTENLKLEVCSDFANFYFANPELIMLSGSQAYGTQTEDSDFDILIFSKDVDKLKNEMVEYKSNMFDVKIIPLGKLDDLLINDYKMSNPVFIEMFAKGVIIKDFNKLLVSLKEKCSYLLQNGPIPKDYLFMKNLKVHTLSRLKSFISSESKDESYLLMLDLIQKFTDLFAYSKNFWIGSSRLIYKQIEVYDKTFHMELKRAMTTFLNNNSVKEMDSFISSRLSFFGKKELLMSSSETMNYVEDNYLVIKVQNKNLDDYSVFAEIALNLHKISEILNDSKDFWVFKPNKKLQGKITASILYIVFFLDKETINERLPFLVNELFGLSKRNTRYFAPISLDISLFYNDYFRFSAVRKLLCGLSNFLIQIEHFDIKESIVFALKLCFEISKKTNEFSLFNAYLFSCWISRSYDMGDHLNYDFLRLLKSRVTDRYEEKYSLQKEAFVSILNEETSNSKDDILNSKIISLIDNIDFLDLESENLTRIYEFNLPEDLPKKEKRKWVLYKITLDYLLGSLLIEEGLKSYFPFVLEKLRKEGRIL